MIHKNKDYGKQNWQYLKRKRGNKTNEDFKIPVKEY